MASRSIKQHWMRIIALVIAIGFVMAIVIGVAISAQALEQAIYRFDRTDARVMLFNDGGSEPHSVPGTLWIIDSDVACYSGYGTISLRYQCSYSPDNEPKAPLYQLEVYQKGQTGTCYPIKSEELQLDAYKQEIDIPLYASVNQDPSTWYIVLKLLTPGTATVAVQSVTLYNELPINGLYANSPNQSYLLGYLGKDAMWETYTGVSGRLFSFDSRQAASIKLQKGKRYALRIQMTAHAGTGIAGPQANPPVLSLAMAVREKEQTAWIAKCFPIYAEQLRPYGQQKDLMLYFMLPDELDAGSPMIQIDYHGIMDQNDFTVSICQWSIEPLDQLTALDITQGGILNHITVDDQLMREPMLRDTSRFLLIEQPQRMLLCTAPVWNKTDPGEDGDYLPAALESWGYYYDPLRLEFVARKERVNQEYVTSDPHSFSTSGDGYSDYERVLGKGVPQTLLDSLAAVPGVPAYPDLRAQLESVDIAPVTELLPLMVNEQQLKWRAIDSAENTSIGLNVAPMAEHKAYVLEANLNDEQKQILADLLDIPVLKIKLNLQVINIGHAAASNVNLVYTLSIGGQPVRSIPLGKADFIAPQGVYPESFQVFEKDSEDREITLTGAQALALCQGQPMELTLDINQATGGVSYLKRNTWVSAGGLRTHLMRLYENTTLVQVQSAKVESVRVVLGRYQLNEVLTLVGLEHKNNQFYLGSQLRWPADYRTLLGRTYEDITCLGAGDRLVIPRVDAASEPLQAPIISSKGHIIWVAKPGQMPQTLTFCWRKDNQRYNRIMLESAQKGLFALLCPEAQSAEETWLEWQAGDGRTKKIQIH